MTTVFDLAFYRPPAGSVPNHAIAYVSLKSSSRRSMPPRFKNLQLLSKEARSMTEFDEDIDYLKRELEEIRKKARARFKAAKSKH